MHDPRTVARDIPSVLNNIFPQLIPNIVGYFNKQAISLTECNLIPNSDFENSALESAMLAELAAAKAEEYLTNNEDGTWNKCLNTALERQRRHFDAVLPHNLSESDKKTADQLAQNIVKMLAHVQNKKNNQPVIISPNIPGFHWIASGVADYSIGNSLIELKCIKKNFGVSDFRQVLIYWMLSYISQLENNLSDEFESIFLINPRLNKILELALNEIIKITSAGRSKKAIIEDFTALIEKHTLFSQTFKSSDSRNYRN